MATLPNPHPLQYLRRESVATSNHLDATTDRWIETLYANRRDFIFRVALRVTRNAGDAEDVVQNVFLRMIRNDSGPAIGSCPVAYLRRAALHTAIDLIRKRAQRAETDLPPDFPDAQQKAAEQKFAEQRHVRQALDKLPPKHAALFEMHCRGYLYLELAERFGMQVGTVKSRLHRIRAVLQEELEAT
jgi:RNA polymerase sigma-70 factor, ECF subfamily